jgi:hypothetical protein
MANYSTAVKQLSNTYINETNNRFHLNYAKWQQHNDGKGCMYAAKFHYAQMQHYKAEINRLIIQSVKVNYN